MRFLGILFRVTPDKHESVLYTILAKGQIVKCVGVILTPDVWNEHLRQHLKVYKGDKDSLHLGLNLCLKITLLEISLWTLKRFGNVTSNGYISTKD
jgi:hypothetical protein